MRLKRLEISGFKSFAKPIKLEFPASICGIVGPNGSGKSNVSESIRWVLGEQSMKSLRGKKGEDLIFNGSQSAPKLGKASVSLVFDNREKVLPIDYDEVTITRKVFRDGVNEYYVNDAQVRLKDIVDILSKVGLGTSSHHIISQGEADRILNASITERRQMIEDALGLKIYQLRKIESERKLERTEENIKQIDALRKEIQPHLKFLKKQVVKAEELSSLREELKKLYIQFFSSEEKYLKSEESLIGVEKTRIEKEITEIKKELSDTPETGQEDSQSVKLKNEIQKDREDLNKKEVEINELRVSRNAIERDLGRIEGMIEATEIREKNEGDKSVPVRYIQKFTSEIENYLNEGLLINSIDDIKKVFSKIKETLNNFLEKSGSAVVVPSIELNDFKKKQQETRNLLNEIESRQKELLAQYESFRKNISEKEISLRGLEKKSYEMVSRSKELNVMLNNINSKNENIRIQKDEFYRERNEAIALVGDDVVEVIDYVINSREERESMRRTIERLKIRLEDSGGVGEEVVKEYDDVKKRDEFFEKELIDLGSAIISLKELLKELEEKINTNFDIGIDKINKQFQIFFESMFGGGKAELVKVAPKKRKSSDAPTLIEDEDGVAGLEDAEEEKKDGIDVSVNLPKKRIHSLDMLSGGERALTSIALLFAMSQVNPPPFLILDETDAALDEANSQKYGQMLKNLSDKTQLLLITHNRETMRQAGVLYGVTMGSDSISKLLSIKFTEAEQYTS